MTRLDTIEFTTHTDFIQVMNVDSFTMTNIEKPNGINITSYSLNAKKLGINKITINKTFETVKINASAKVLGSNYYQGISLNTLEQLLDEVNSTGLVLNKSFIHNCRVTKSDIKNDLTLSKCPIDYINTLNQLTAPKFIKTKYENGIVFNESIATSPVRFTGYGKQYEMQKNKGFYIKYPQLINDFNDVLRIESRLSKPFTIRKYFGSNQLLDVLNSSNINYKILDKIINNQTIFKSIINIHQMNNFEEKNYAQIYLLNQYYNGDFNSIFNHIKSKLGRNTKASYQRKQIVKYMAMINNANNDYSQENIEEIKMGLQE